MSDHSELKRLAEAATPGPWAYDGSYVCPARTEDGTTYVELWRSIADCHQPENTKFIAAANPAAVLALIAEVEGLRAQHGRDSAELRSLCKARDYARKERDQLKAEVESLRKDAGQLKADNDSARMRIKELDLLFGRYILAMRSALIEEEHGKGPAAAMEWIYNSLAGPGELPPEGETDSQAYFDREIVDVDDGMQEVMAFHEARITATDKREKV